MVKNLLYLLFLIPLLGCPQDEQVIEIGTFNIEWFPCKDDGAMMKQYGIELRYPPEGKRTDVQALFALLKTLDIELLGVEEIVDPKMLADSAKKYLGEEFEFIYSPSGGDQKVGFLYDSSVLELVGAPQTYAQVELKPGSRLRPAFRAYFKTKPNGFDFHAIVTHLKASPRGLPLREQQWRQLNDILKELPEETKDSDIVLLGDFNNVSKFGTAEFDTIMTERKFYRATSELKNGYSNYWQPDYKVERIQGSLIDHIFVSEDAKIEYIEHSTRVGGMCGSGVYEFSGDSIPDYYNLISDHCPVFGSFKAGKDDD